MFNIYIFLQLVVADRRLKSTQKFLKDQTAEREFEREEFDYKLDVLKGQLKERERESLDTQDLRSHVMYFYSFLYNYEFTIFIIFL